MKVAICIPIDLNVHGGVEKHILRLAENMRCLGLCVDVFGKAAPSAVRDTISGSAHDYAEQFLPLSRFRHERYHIIHTHSGFYGPRFWAMQMTRLPRQRYVHTLHTVSLDYLLACRAWFNWRCYYATCIEAMWSRYADRVIAVSGSIRDWTVRCYGISPRKISVIYNGFTLTVLPAETRSQTRASLGLSMDDLVLLFVGRGEDPVKGTAQITAAMNRLHRRYPHIRLLAAPGSGFAPAPWFCCAGSIPHQRMPELYAAADIFVNASFSEGMPLTVIEAMVMGLPVVAAPVGGIPEIVTHDHSGLLLRPDHKDLADQIVRLIENPSLRQRLARNARAAASHLTWRNLAEQTINLYESLLYPRTIGLIQL